MQRRKSQSAIRETYDRLKSEPKKCIQALKKHIREGQKKGDAHDLGAAYYYTALCYYDLHDLEGIFISALKAYTLLKDTDDYTLTADVLNALGYVYNLQENPQMALSNNEEAYRLMKKHRIGGFRRITLLNNFSICSHMFGKYDAAIRYLKECMELLHKEMPDDYINLAMYTLNLAEYQKDNGQPEKSRETLLPMAEWVEKIDYPALRCDYFLRCAINAYVLGDKEEGKRYADIAIARVPTDYFARPVYEDLRTMMHYFCEDGDRERMKKVFDLMVLFSEKEKGTVEQEAANRAFAEYYRALGEHERACEYYEVLGELYEKRMRELREMQQSFHDRTKKAEAEIKDLRKKMRLSEERNSIEPMTGLLNRAALLNTFAEFIKIASKKKGKVGAIFIDIDFFKECNDTSGHAKGDEIIKAVASACKAEDCANVRFARYGGDEFFGITRCLRDDEVVEITRRIFARIRQADFPHEKNPNGQRITLSAGVVNVAVNEHTGSILEIANFADKAVYHAKSNGKNAIYLLDRSDAEKDSVYKKIDF